MCVSPPSMSRLTSIQFPTVASPFNPIVSHFHPGHAIFISPSSRSGLISIQVARLAAQLHPCSISPHPGLKIFILPPSISCLTPSRSLDLHFTFIQVRLHLHPGKFSLQDLFLWCRFISPASKFQYPYFTPIHVLPHFHPGPRFHVSSVSMSRHLHSSRDIWITTPSMSYLTPIHVSILTPELHPDHVSPPSRSHD